MPHPSPMPPLRPLPPARPVLTLGHVSGVVQSPLMRLPPGPILLRIQYAGVVLVTLELGHEPPWSQQDFENPRDLRLLLRPAPGTYARLTATGTATGTCALVQEYR